MTWRINKSRSPSSSGTGTSSSSKSDEFHDAAEYTNDHHNTTTALRPSPQLDVNDSTLLQSNRSSSSSIELSELGIVDDTAHGAHHGSIVVLPDTYSSVIMDCDSINDSGGGCSSGGSPDAIDTMEQDDDQRRQCGRSVHDAQRVITDEEGGVLWSLKQNLMNRGLSWSDRLLDTTEAALDVTEKAVGFILSDDNNPNTTPSSNTEGSKGAIEGANTVPIAAEGKSHEVTVEGEGHSLSEPAAASALSVEEFTSSDEDIRSRFLSASSSVSSSSSRTSSSSLSLSPNPLASLQPCVIPSLSGPPPALLPGQRMNTAPNDEGVLEEALRSMKRIRLDTDSAGSDDRQQDDDLAAFEARQQLLQDEADAMSTISTASSMKRGRASVPISGYNDDIILPTSLDYHQGHHNNNGLCRRQRWIRVRDRVQQVSSTIYCASWSQVKHGSLRATGCVAGMAAQKVRSMVVGGVPVSSPDATTITITDNNHGTLSLDGGVLPLESGDAGECSKHSQYCSAESASSSSETGGSPDCENP